MMWSVVPYVILSERLNNKFSELQLQFSLILRVAGYIWQILQISAVICRILQIPPGSANSKPKFLSKKLAKVCSQKSYNLGLWFGILGIDRKRG